MQKHRGFTLGFTERLPLRTCSAIARASYAVSVFCAKRLCAMRLTPAPAESLGTKRLSPISFNERTWRTSNDVSRLGRAVAITSKPACGPAVGLRFRMRSVTAWSCPLLPTVTVWLK